MSSAEFGRRGALSAIGVLQGVEPGEDALGVLAEPWWRGAASPSVLYGNDAIFERAMTTASMAAPAERALDIAEAAINEARRQA